MQARTRSGRALLNRDLTLSCKMPARTTRAEAGICALQVLKHVQFFMQDASSDEEEKKAQPAVDDSIPERQRHRVVRGRGRGRLPFGGLGRGGR